MRMRVGECVGGCVGGRNLKKKNHTATTAGKFATIWYLFHENRSTNVEGVCGHIDRQTILIYIDLDNQ